jgi:hypothetical protein
MNGITLSNILWAAVPDQGFSINGDVDNESDYNSNVVYSDPSQKPSWSVVQAGQVPEQWVVVKAERKSKLEASDWTVLPDVPMPDSERDQWKVYRQALRDITDQPDPFNINWPTPPA